MPDSKMLKEALADAAALREAAAQQAREKLIEEKQEEIQKETNKILFEQDDELDMGLDDGNFNDPNGFDFEDDLGMMDEPGMESDEFVDDQVPAAYAEKGDKLCPCPDDEQEVEFDLDDLIRQAEEEEDEMMPSDLEDREEVAMDMPDDEEETLSEEEIDSMLSEMGYEDDELELDEEYSADMSAEPSGWSPRTDMDFEYEFDKMLAKELGDDDPKMKRHHEVDETMPAYTAAYKRDADREPEKEVVEATEESADTDKIAQLAGDLEQQAPDYMKKGLKQLQGLIGELEADRKGDQSGSQAKRDVYEEKFTSTLKEFGQNLKEKFTEHLNVYKEQNKKLRSLNEKKSQSLEQLQTLLEESDLDSAKLLYQNKVLQDASLNRRQQNKLVESISATDTVKEAKRLYELRSEMGVLNENSNPSGRNHRTQNPIQEALDKKSGFTSQIHAIRNNKKQIDESVDPEIERRKRHWQKLAGINKTKNNN